MLLIKSMLIRLGLFPLPPLFLWSRIRASGPCHGSSRHRLACEFPIPNLESSSLAPYRCCPQTAKGLHIPQRVTGVPLVSATARMALPQREQHSCFRGHQQARRVEVSNLTLSQFLEKMPSHQESGIL